MSGPNLSPEDILRKKEQIGGISYDDPISDLSPPSPQIVDTPKELENLQRKNTPMSDSPLAAEFKKVESGATDNLYSKELPPSIEIGWKNLPVSILPSRGLFYPDGTQIAIRPAEVKEIRHFSTIDESDMLDVDAKLNMVLNSCCVMKFPGEGVVSYRDLKQEDRFFIIMAIRDLSFVKGENRIVLTPDLTCKKDNCAFKHGIELRTGVLTNYQINQKLMKYYSKTDRKFIFPVSKIGKSLSMTVPSIGVIDAISNYIKNSVRTGKDIDESFIKIAPFLFDDWRGLDDKKIQKASLDSEDWSNAEFSIYFQLAEDIKIGTKLEVSLPCQTCGASEVTAPISFPGGFRSLFLISDIFGELL
jgi:hypothetical protein